VSFLAWVHRAWRGVAFGRAAQGKVEPWRAGRMARPNAGQPARDRLALESPRHVRIVNVVRVLEN